MFAHKLRSLRHKLGLKQSEMADRLHVDTSTYCRWEHNEHPSTHVIERITKTFRVDAWAWMRTEAPIPVAVVDDHTLVRNALAEMIHRTERFNVVLQAVNGAEYIRAVKQGAEVAVAVVDLHMPVMNGFETIAWIRANTPGTHALALSFEVADAVRERAIEAGACGFLRKDCRKEQFLGALDQAAMLGHYSPRSAE